jgi:hypothetical protein
MTLRNSPSGCSRRAVAFCLGSNSSPGTWMRLFAARVLCAAHHDAPLIGDRRNVRGRSATEGGDAHADVRRTSSVRAPASRTGSIGGGFDPLAATRATGARTPNPVSEAAGLLWREGCTPRPPPSPTTMRHSSTNAPQRAGASQRKVAMSAPVQRGAIRSRSISRTGSSGGNLGPLAAKS